MAQVGTSGGNGERHSKRPQSELGHAIRTLRLERRKTQRALAADAGITVAHLSKIERGHTNPTWACVRSIARALSLTVTGIALRAEAGSDTP